jgi:hypothetical protein
MDGAQRVWQTFEKYRPLLRTTPCKDLPLYQEAEALLDMKKRLFM